MTGDGRAALTYLGAAQALREQSGGTLMPVDQAILDRFLDPAVAALTQREREQALAEGRDPPASPGHRRGTRRVSSSPVPLVRVRLVSVRTRVAGVLLAAGGGTRLGRPKALVRIAGQSLAERGVALLRAGGAAPVVVVTGAVAAEPLGVLIVHNPDWRSGMGSSLAVGLTALPGTAEAAVIALADQPLVGPEAVRRLIAAYEQGAGVAGGRL